MRLKNVPGSREVIAESRFVIHNPEENKGKWAGVFGNDAPLHIEIGKMCIRDRKQRAAERICR